MTHPMYSTNSFRLCYLHKPMTQSIPVVDHLDDFTCWVLFRDELVSCFGAQNSPRYSKNKVWTVNGFKQLF